MECGYRHLYITPSLVGLVPLKKEGISSLSSPLRIGILMLLVFLDHEYPY